MYRYVDVSNSNIGLSFVVRTIKVKLKPNRRDIFLYLVYCMNRWHMVIITKFKGCSSIMLVKFLPKSLKNVTNYKYFLLTNQAPPLVTVVLKVRMHCEACALAIQKRIRKIQGTKIHPICLSLPDIDCSCVLSPTPYHSSTHQTRFRSTR